MRKVVLAILVLGILLGSIAGGFYLVSRNSSPAFTLSVFPTQLKGDAIAGQRVVFLVTALDNEPGQKEAGIKITASAAGAAVAVEPEMISPGQVGEVFVIPDLEAVDSNVTVVISAERSGLEHSQAVEFAVVPGEDTVGDYARQLRDTFVQWLELNHPELGITNQTQWMGTIVSPRWLVVTHYLFFSKDWEMHVYWHVMIPPYDWARIDLRHRGTGLAPQLSFEISSLNGTSSPQAIPPPDTTWR